MALGFQDEEHAVSAILLPLLFFGQAKELRPPTGRKVLPKEKIAHGQKRNGNWDPICAMRPSGGLIILKSGFVRKVRVQSIFRDYPQIERGVSRG